MEVPTVTEELVRQLRGGYPNADLVYAGDGRLRVRRPHQGVVEGERLYSSQRLDTWRPTGNATTLNDAEHAARLTAQLAPIIEELVTRERAEAILDQLNSYDGNDIWTELIEKLPDFDQRLPPEYPSYVRSAYDRRHHDSTATTREFVALGGRAVFLLDRRDNRWRVEYTKNS